MNLIDDIVCHICNFLPDAYKLGYLSTTQKMHQLKNRIKFNTKVPINKIFQLPYFDNFTNVMLRSEDIQKFPKCATHLELYTPINVIPPTVKKLTLKTNKIFNTNFSTVNVTHLYLDYPFDQPINKFNMPNVTHLILGITFNHSLSEIIFPNVVYISFAPTYRRNIDLLQMEKIREIHIFKRYNRSINVPIECKIIRYDRRQYNSSLLNPVKTIINWLRN